MAAVYLTAGLLWIWLTDRALLWFGIQAGEQGFLAAAGKGTLFVLLSTALVYWLVRREFRSVHRAFAMLRAVTEGTTDAVFVKDRAGKYLLFNTGAARLVGKSVEEVLGKDDATLFDLESARQLRERDCRVMERGEPETSEEFLTAAGVRRVYSAMKAPYRDEAGKIIGVVGISRDISDQLQAQEEMRQHDIFVRGVLDSMTAHIAVLNGSGEILAVNESWRKFAENNSAERGPSPRTGINTNYLEVCDASARNGCTDATAAAEGIRRLMAGEATRFQMEYPCHSPDEQRWFLLSVTRFDHKHGGVVVSHTNITEQRRTQAAVHENEQRLRLALQTARGGVWDWNIVTGEIWWSDEMYDLWGIAPGTRIEFAPSFNTIDPVDREYVRRKVEEAVAGGADYRCQYRILLPSGDSRSISSYGRVIRDEAGTPLHLLGISLDVTEQRLAEKTLRDRERLLGIVTDCARVGLVVVGDDYQYLFANKAYSEIFGLAKEIAGRKVPEVLATGWSQIQPRLDRSLAGERLAYELQMPPLPGETGARWYRVMYEPRTGYGAKPNVVVVVAEITDQKRAEATIRASEERYRRLVEILPTAVFVNDGGRIAFCNSAFGRMMGAASPQDLLGKTPFEIFHPDVHPLLRARIETLLVTNREVPSVEMKLVRLDGRTIPVHSVATPITGYGPQAILVALSDLTDRERSLNLLHSVLASVADAILTINARGIVQSVNVSTQRLFGYEADEVIGRNVCMLMPEPYQHEHDQYIADYLRTGVAKVIGIGREVVGKRKDGSTFPLELTVTEFQIEGERHFTGVVRDITARKQLESQFHQSQKMEAIGQLAGGVAHDFNNLLTIISGYSELVQETLGPVDPRAEYLIGIRDASDRAAALTRQLLIFSRKQVVEPKVLNINAVVAELGKMVMRLIGEDITLTLKLQPHIGYIDADAGQLEQVLINLAVNARDAMPQGGRLTITTADTDVSESQGRLLQDLPPGSYVTLTVADTGYGMDEATRAHAFEPFFTTKGPGKGTGLGLATVFGIIAQSGGRIAVRSEPGAGAEFTIYFPRVESEHEFQDVPIDSAPTARGTETILLVEDEEALRDMVALVLSSCGYTILSAAGGDDALRIAAKHRGEVNLLVTDVVMPGMSGRELSERLSALSPDVKVLFMSGYTDDSVVRYGVLRSETAFLQKPFTPSALAQKVRDVLDQNAGTGS